MSDPLQKAAVVAPRPPPLLKYKSWSPDSDREEAWLRRRDTHIDRRRSGHLSRSVTDEDLDELRGCIELGFGFDADLIAEDVSGSSTGSCRLSDTLPALDLYYAVHRQYSEAMAGDRSSSNSSSSAGSSPLSIYSPGDSPLQVKARLKQWARVVACSVRQLY